MDGPKAKSAPADEAIAVAHDDDREPTKEEIMDDIRQGLRDVLAGEQGMPAREGLEAMRRRIYDVTEIR
ncbi:MAG: hypothetical protein OXI77_07680 [Chloroflexota bacterium]|nr:hypothetical protein [Chloroflexota bacterium]MDE2908355.1 hypothetical protein [Chloroflexota bacterium]